MQYALSYSGTKFLSTDVLVDSVLISPLCCAIDVGESVHLQFTLRF